MCRCAIALSVLAALLAAAPAQATRSTPIRTVGELDYRRNQAVLTSDGDRYVGYVRAGTTSARVRDTKTGKEVDVPGCRLGAGSHAVFLAACEGGYQDELYDVRTRRRRPIRGRERYDHFNDIGRHWIAGTDDTPVNCGNKCPYVLVHVNRRTGRRIACAPDYEDGCELDLDTPSGAHPPWTRFTFVDERLALVLRERGRPDTNLSQPGACIDASDYCTGNPEGGRVTWTEADLPDGRRAHVRGFNLRTRRRAAWKVPRDFACPGTGDALQAFAVHTRWEVWFAGLVPQYPDEYACRSVALYAARWPSPLQTR
jgi:hypothetical protein